MPQPPSDAPAAADASDPLTAAVQAALATVIDPEIRRPVTEIGMIRNVTTVPGDRGAHVTVGLDLTTPSCPMRNELVGLVRAAVGGVAGVGEVTVDVGAMTAEQRAALRVQLRGGTGEPVIPFAQPGNLTKVFAISSGKGGVGKSSVTANLAAQLAADGLSVGVVDADIHGFSIPRMLGVQGRPTRVDDMLMPPIAHGVRVVSIGMFTPEGRAVVWRGPMLHRALQQFLADVWWGDLDVLLLDLPPGTGDVAISVAQLLPGSQLVVVTTPQQAAAEVAVRAGALAEQTRQGVAGVVENMSWFEQPDGSRLEIFGSGGGAQVAAELGSRLGGQVPLLGQVPLDVSLREAGDEGLPLVLRDPSSPAAQALREVARRLVAAPRGLAGMSLTVTPVGR